MSATARPVPVNLQRVWTPFQNSSTWAGLEDYILKNASTNKFRASVFTGPVLVPEDQMFNGVQLPGSSGKLP